MNKILKYLCFFISLVWNVFLGRLSAASFNIPLASLTDHNTSAYPAYNQSNFPANFGDTSWVAQSGTTIAVDPSKMDMSLNPVTPGHVSQMDVHTLIPSRPDLRWFAHACPWFGNASHINIGLNCNSAGYVQAMVTDMQHRGFDGVIIDWYGQSSYENAVTLLLQQYLASVPGNNFKFIIMIDRASSQADLQTKVEYCQSQYFTDPNYECEGGKPILLFFTALDATTMAAVKTATGNNMVWVGQGPGSLSNAWCDQCFDWTRCFYNGVNQNDPYNLSSVAGYYTSISGSAKKAFGAMCSGFNGTLTKTIAWSMGKYLPQGNGACIVQRANKINTVITPNVTRMQWATWDDWEEGTPIEPGIENNVTVSGSVSGSTLNWTYTSGTGDESTIDHYEIYASIDNVNAAAWGSVAAGTHAFNLTSVGGLVAGTHYLVYVQAIGKPCICDHLSSPISYVPSSSTGTNIAWHQPAFASSTDSTSRPAGLAVDGNGTTRWSSAYSDPQWIYVDLGQSCTINTVVLNWETAYASAYTIQVSADAVQWTDVYSTTLGDGGTDIISITPASGRYVRIYGTARATQWGYSLFEFEVYGTQQTSISICQAPMAAEAARLLYANPVWAAELSRYLRMKKDLIVCDLTGKAVDKTGFYQGGIYLLHDKSNKAFQKIMVLK